MSDYVHSIQTVETEVLGTAVTGAFQIRSK